MLQKPLPHAFKPGQSGNPNGRPKSHLNQTLSRLLAAKCPGRKFNNEEAVCRVVIELAKEGDKDMIEFIFDRMLGKPSQSIDMSSAGLPVKFTISLGDQGSQRE